MYVLIRSTSVDMFLHYVIYMYIVYSSFETTRYTRHEETKFASLRSELLALRQEASRLREDAGVNKRQMMEVSNRLKRKAEERNELKRSITELKNAQEEEETEVDTATYVSSRITYRILSNYGGKKINLRLGLALKLEREN